MNIVIDDLSGKDIALFLEQHMQDMFSASPPECVFALDLQALKAKEITFWSVRDEGAVIGCGALKELSADLAEIKSMRVSTNMRGTGLASQLLKHIIQVSKERTYRQLSLETGSMDFFIPARKLYEKHGFEYCGPFSDYKLDPHSVFMTLKL